VPLLSLAECVARNLLNTSAMESVAFARGRKMEPADWSVNDAAGNTPLHLLFSTQLQPDKNDRCFGAPVQVFALHMLRDTPVHQRFLADVDLLAQNAAGQTVLSLIARHCLQPRSRRSVYSRNGFWSHWKHGGHPPPEQYPRCLHVSQMLYARWLPQRVPLLRQQLEAQLIPDLANIAYEESSCYSPVHGCFRTPLLTYCLFCALSALWRLVPAELGASERPADAHLARTTLRHDGRRNQGSTQVLL